MARITVAVAERIAKRARAIAALRGEKVQEIMRQRLEQYVNEYRGLIEKGGEECS